MAKNRRYSSYSSSSGRSSRTSRSRLEKRENPLFTGVALIVGVFLAALCGRTLDARFVAASTGGSPGSAGAEDSESSGRAALRLETKGQSDASSAVREIERLSGVEGAAPLPSEHWSTETPLLLGEVDVSGLLAQEFTLKRSLLNGYAPKSIRLGANFSRVGTFFDLMFKDEKGAAQILRLEEGTIAVIYRSPSGIESERVRIPFTGQKTPEGRECGAITLESASTSEQGEVPQVLKCHSIQDSAALDTVLATLPPLPVRGRFVSVSTNLVKSEVRELVISGMFKGVPVEDRV